jgi:hypothetical protein
VLDEADFEFWLHHRRLRLAETGGKWRCRGRKGVTLRRFGRYCNRSNSKTKLKTVHIEVLELGFLVIKSLAIQGGTISGPL